MQFIDLAIGVVEDKITLSDTLRPFDCAGRAAPKCPEQDALKVIEGTSPLARTEHAAVP